MCDTVSSTTMQVPNAVPTEANRDELATISFPVSTMRRIVKSAAPGSRFSSEALAGLHRVVQTYCLYAFDRASGEMRQENAKLRKTKGKTGPLRKTLGPDNFMNFLSAEFPPLATKLSTLFPDLMPVDHRPAALQLLAQYHEQLRPKPKAPEDEAAGDGPAPEAPKAQPRSLAAAFAQVAAARADDPAAGDAAQIPEAAVPAKSHDAGPADVGVKRAATEEQGAHEPASKKARKEAASAAPKPPPRSLQSFFGAPKSGPAQAHEPEPEQAAPAQSDQDQGDAPAQPPADDDGAHNEAAREEAAHSEAAREEAAQDEAAREEAMQDAAAREEAAQDEAAREEAAQDEAAP